MNYETLTQRAVFKVRIFKALKILKCSPRQALNPTKSDLPRSGLEFYKVLENIQYD